MWAVRRDAKKLFATLVLLIDLSPSGIAKEQINR